MSARGFCPFAVHKLIPPGANDPPIKPRVAILHVDAGNAASLYEFFRDRSGGIEAHFFVKKDGTIEQYRSVFFQADANLDANDFAVSIETQGLGAGTWNRDQLDAIKRLLVWLRDVIGIPLRKCPRWDASGVGYHVQFGAPGHWTPVAKSCPGPERIRQFEDVLVPWFRNPKVGKPMTNKVEHARELARNGLDDIHAALKLLRDVDSSRGAVATMTSHIAHGANEIADAIATGPTS